MAEHYGQPVTDFMHPADIPDVVERLAQLTEHGQFFEHGEVRIVAPGRRRPPSWRSPAIRTTLGRASRPTR